MLCVWRNAAASGLFPALVQMFLVFPLATPFGIGGVGLGAATPVFVLIFNTIGWSLPACGWFILTGAAALSVRLYSSCTFRTCPL